MESLRKTTGFTIAQRYDNLDLLDTATRAHQKQIGDNYLLLLQANRKREKEIWETAYAIWTALGAVYLQCVEQASADPVATAKIKAKLPLIAARGARAAGIHIKWISFRFGQVDSSIWKDLARCLSFTEENDFADKSVPLYLSNQAKSSVGEEFLRAAMLFASTADSLTVMEQEIADRWIEHFTSAFVPNAKPAKGLTLCFDLNAAQPPRRAMGAQVKGARLCYFGATETLPQIQEYIDATKKTGVTPVPFRLPKGGETKHVVKVLQHLLLHWGEEPPAREWDRRLTTSSIEIRHDFGTLLQTIQQVESGDLDFTGRSARPEFWIVDNAGRGGYSAIVPKGLRAWLRLGALTALRLEFRDFWSVAVIRRLESDEHQQRKVGYA